jgi:hypothetical protein
MDDKLRPPILATCCVPYVRADERQPSRESTAAKIMAKIVAERIAAQLARDRLVIMRKPPEGGAGGVPRRD